MLDYKKAGVDTEKARTYITDLKSVIQSTHSKAAQGSVIDNYGGFAGIFQPAPGHAGSNLVAATDGVGTKIHLARKFQYLEGLGQDLVAMCVNDLYCVGATPLFFLDYISCGKLDNSWYRPVIESIAKACELTGMALLGGETAEHPGVMEEDDFDLAGFCVGSVAPEKHLPKISEIQEGDLLYGFSSSGPHSNGFSLVRKISEEMEKKEPEKFEATMNNPEWVKTNLLAPTRIYTFLPELLRHVNIKALAHITGGGLYENIERILPENCCAQIENTQAFSKEIFQFMEDYVQKRDLYATFNMGIGLAAVVSPDMPNESKNKLEENGAKLIGKIVARKNSPVIVEGVDT